MQTARRLRLARMAGQFSHRAVSSIDRCRLRCASPREWLRPVLLVGAFVLAWSILAGLALAQLPQTRLYAVFPAGGQVGTTFDLAVTRGEDLEDVSRLLFSHPGITATAKTTTNAAGRTEIVPQQFSVTIAADVPPGVYDVVADGRFGVSNPRLFVVGRDPERTEVEPNNAREQAQPIEPGLTINGRTGGAADIDLFKFVGQPGQRVLLECVARRIDSRLDANLELLDVTGRRVAAAHGNLDSDALLDFTITEPGEYVVRLTDFVYTGNDQDYFYRLTWRTGPWIDFVVPPAGVPGSTTKFTLYGRNLPAGTPSDIRVGSVTLEQQTVEIAVPADRTGWPKGTRVEPYAAARDGFVYSLPSDRGPSNPVSIAFSDVPVTPEQEPNNTPQQVNPVTVPAAIAGQFQKSGDVDLYQFDAKAGEVVLMQVQGQRLGSAVDPYLTVDQVTKNDQGVEQLKRIASVDDDATNSLPIVFDTVSDDPVYRFAAPADGSYRIVLRDRFGASRGAPSLQYLLELRRESPDFRAVAVTTSPQPPNTKNPQSWSVSLRKGDNVPVSVIVLRQDGFTGDVTVTAEGLPAGVTCRPIDVGTTPSQGTLILEAAADAAPWSGPITIVARAKMMNPADEAAVVAARAAIKPARDALAAATAAVTKPATELQQAQEALTKAQADLATAPEDEAKKKAVAEAQVKVDQLKPAADTAQAALVAAQEKLAAAEKGLADALAGRDQRAREVVREARYGTIVWNGGANIPGQGRLVQSLQLSILPEESPIQISTSVHRVVANHNRQILVPVHAVRRQGFDGDITLTFQGQPPNLQLENKPIKKGTDQETLRLFVPNNVPVGTYVMYLVAQGSVPYRRFPERVDQYKADLTLLQQQATAAEERQKTRVAERDKAVTDSNAAQEALKQAQAEKTTAEQGLATAQATEKQAAEEAAKASGDAVTAAQQKLTEAQTAVKAATEKVAEIEAKRVAAQTAVTMTETAKATTEAAVKQGENEVKAAQAQVAAADKRVKDAEAAAAPKNINYLPPSTPIVLTVKTAPCTVAAAVGNGGQLKRGMQTEVTVTVTRQNDFAGPLTVTLEVPERIKGVTAAPVTIPAGETKAVLMVQAAADATEGALANVVVRAAGEMEGPTLVDQPVTITVAP